MSGMQQCASCNETVAWTKGENRVECFCRPDFFNPANSTGVGPKKQCEPCPRGATCINDRIVGKEGFWRSNLLDEALYNCNKGLCLGESKLFVAALGLPTEHSILEDLNGGRTDEEKAGLLTLNSTCRPGHQGRLCQSCLDGYAVQVVNGTPPAHICHSRQVLGFWGFTFRVFGDLRTCRPGVGARRASMPSPRGVGALLRVVRKVFCRPLHAKLVGPSDRVCHDTHSDGVAVKAIAKGEAPALMRHIWSIV
eukprot:1194248-Prorocentrum_minimum.AAC.2